MKRIFLAATLGSLLIGAGSCDKVENPFPNTGGATLDWSLYPDGDSAHYAQNAWPAFSTNPNTLRNVLIEDFTGHQCVNCPAQTAFMESLIQTNPARIYGVAIHAGPSGLTGYQVTSSAFPSILYNDQGLEIGEFFGSMPGTAFLGNPGFAVNRTISNDQYITTAGGITQKTNNALASSLRVNLQAATNYYPSTRGLFLHVEADKIDQSISNDLGLVVYVVEDSLVARQIVQTADDPDGVPGDPDLNHKDGIYEAYVHHDIMRGCIDGMPFGKTLSPAHLGANNKYYVNYSYRLPDQYNVDNMHLLIYVYDKTTYEIYHVVEQEMH
jgi:hypothetical protein